MSNGSWGDFSKYAECDHWLWKKLPNPPGGHVGMDYMLVYRLIQTMRLGLVPDMDVYDAATWAAPVALSSASIKAGSSPVEFLDFTRGKWTEKRSGVDSIPA